MWLASDPDRPARVRSRLDAVVRAGRMVVDCACIARDYKMAKRTSAQAEPAELAIAEAQHKEAQRIAAYAERERVAAPDAAAAAAYARRTREDAVRLGAESAVQRLAHESEHNLDAFWEGVHEKCAVRLLHLCLANGGVYVKLGQHLAQLDYLVPAPYTRVLSQLFQGNRPSSTEAVVELIEEDLGRPLHELFSSFDPQPLASASLAQVHRATDRASGQLVAVKVQHPGLRDAADADMAAVAAIVHLAGWLFPDDFRLRWVVDELAPHLPLEVKARGPDAVPHESVPHADHDSPPAPRLRIFSSSRPVLAWDGWVRNRGVLACPHPPRSPALAVTGSWTLHTKQRTSSAANTSSPLRGALPHCKVA